MPPVFQSAPNEPHELIGTRNEVLASLKLQAGIRRLLYSRQYRRARIAAVSVQAVERGRALRADLPARELQLLRHKEEHQAATAIQTSYRRRPSSELRQAQGSVNIEEVVHEASADPAKASDAIATPGHEPTAETDTTASEAVASPTNASEGEGSAAASEEQEASAAASEEQQASAATSEEEQDPAVFTIRNLDTGEIVAVDLSQNGKESCSAPVSGRLGTSSEQWQALKDDSKGLLEKLASCKTLSFRSYQLCVWQERYVFAEDDALCYQHISSEMQPVGESKRILFSTIEFVGPFDETQFVVKCANRAYTFLCDSTATRTRWIKNISALAGCSATLEVCHKTTTMGQ